MSLPPTEKDYVDNIQRAVDGNFGLTFKFKLKSALEQGILLAVKYGLVLVIAYLALVFATNVVSGSGNGNAALGYLQQAIEKGYLPRPGQDGQVPVKEK